MTDTRTIDVCVASLGRPSLRVLMQALDRCELPHDTTIRMIVADDSGKDKVRALRDGMDVSYPIEIVPAGSHNISTARNLTLDTATADLVAFVDDDEWPEPDWLMQLSGAMERHGADAVIGSVRGLIPDQAPSWIKTARPFDRYYGANGTRMSTGVTSNALVKRDAIEARSLRFDERYGTTGGEDTDFFARLAGTGGIIVSSPEAVVSEHVPMDRLTDDHLRTRYMRGGYSHARATAPSLGTRSRAAFYARGAVKYAVLTTMSAALRFVRPGEAKKMAVRAWAARGELLYGLGRPSPRPYGAKDRSA